MPDLLLSDAEQTALRSLLAAEPPADSPFPDRPVLEALCRLIPCDAVGVVVADSSGYVLQGVVEPHGYTDDEDPRACTGPLPVGIQRWGMGPGYREKLDAIGVSQGLSLGFRTGPDHVVQMWMDRRHGTFCSRDLAMLALLAPALQRLLRDRPTTRLPECLTLQERRVLNLVGAGWSNAEIAERMCVATSTVRKHLEHVYRKLGVTNRVAAVTVLHGRASGHPDLPAKAGPPETFA
jgi:DNA-binding CsgD family transcriptional regulator